MPRRTVQFELHGVCQLDYLVKGKHSHHIYIDAHSENCVFFLFNRLEYTAII